MKYTDVVKRNTVKMVSVSASFATFKIDFDGSTFQFDVPLNDIGTGTLKVEDNAMYFSRWIRKSMEDGQFLKIKEVSNTLDRYTADKLSKRTDADY